MSIYESICAIMGEIDAIGKNRKNQQQGFMYRGVEDVMNTINPALTKHKVFIVPEVIEQTRDERTTNKGGLLIYSICKVKFTFYAEDGSSVSAVVIGEGMDSGDKATNKAMSIAFKYACFQVFCIPTEEMKDPDAECHEVAPKVKGEIVNKPSRSIPGYPSNKIMLEIVNKHYPEGHADRDKICEIYKVKDISELPTEAVSHKRGAARYRGS